jgi:hypothetical protein
MAMPKEMPAQSEADMPEAQEISDPQQLLSDAAGALGKLMELVSSGKGVPPEAAKALSSALDSLDQFGQIMGQDPNAPQPKAPSGGAVSMEAAGNPNARPMV